MPFRTHDYPLFIAGANRELKDADGTRYFTSLHPDRPGALPRFREYVTALAHLNGTMDVAFDPRNSDPAEYGGDSAAFNPESETCSAVACHPGGKDYRWAAPHKGLPALPEETP